jgi:phage N-6-adenine-methyltransferase
MTENKKFWTEIQASSKKDDWETPQFLFDALHNKYNFTLDACASHENAKLPNYYTKKEDALIQKWGGRTFCNPPYNRSVGKWAKKAYEESQQPYNELVCLLIPARVDTSYWHEYIFGKAEITFLRGRLKFEIQGVSGDPATFPSAIVVYGTEKKDITFKEQSEWKRILLESN